MTTPGVHPIRFTPPTGKPRSAAELQAVMKPRPPTVSSAPARAPTGAPAVAAPSPAPPVPVRAAPGAQAPFAYVLGPRATEGSCWVLGCETHTVREVEGTLLCEYHTARVESFRLAGAPSWAAAFVAMLRHHMLEHALCDGCRQRPVGLLERGQYSTRCPDCRAAGAPPTACRVPTCTGVRAYASANLALDGLCEGCKRALREDAEALGRTPTPADWIVLLGRRIERVTSARQAPVCTQCKRTQVQVHRAPDDHPDLCRRCYVNARAADRRAIETRAKAKAKQEAQEAAQRLVEVHLRKLRAAFAKPPAEEGVE